MNPDWLTPSTLRDATRMQREIAEAAEPGNRIGTVRTIAGCDTSSKWRDVRGPIHAAIAPFGWPEGEAHTPATLTALPRFPYVPGYLGFREAPALVAAWARLTTRPDLLLVDGQGRAHPRRCGIAVQLGVLLDVPAIGIAKSLLCGAIDGEVGPAPGDRAAVIDRGEVVAIALRTRARAAPIFVSGGHRVALDTAVGWAMRLAAGRRLPRPIRLAHDAANAQRRQFVDHDQVIASNRQGPEP